MYDNKQSQCLEHILSMDNLVVYLDGSTIISRVENSNSTDEKPYLGQLFDVKGFIFGERYDLSIPPIYPLVRIPKKSSFLFNYLLLDQWEDSYDC